MYVFVCVESRREYIHKLDDDDGGGDNNNKTGAVNGIGGFGLDGRFGQTSY